MARTSENESNWRHPPRAGAQSHKYNLFLSGNHVHDRFDTTTPTIVAGNHEEHHDDNYRSHRSIFAQKYRLLISSKSSTKEVQAPLHQLSRAQWLLVLAEYIVAPGNHKFIEANSILRKEFKRATSSRSAKSANEGFVLIAALILSTEILALELAGWATRYPAAHKKARALVAEHLPGSGALLTARYLVNLRSAESRPAEAVASGT